MTNIDLNNWPKLLNLYNISPYVQKKNWKILTF